MILDVNVTEISRGFVTVIVPDDASDEDILDAAREQVHYGYAVYSDVEYEIRHKNKEVTA